MNAHTKAMCYQVLRAAVGPVDDFRGRERVRNLLREFGAVKVSGVSARDVPRLVERCISIMETK